MENELLQVLHQFGIYGLLSVCAYMIIDTVSTYGLFILIGYGIKKAWPEIKKIIEGH